MFVGIAAMVAGLVSPVLAVERDGGSSSRPEFLTGLETPTTRPAIAIEPIPGPQAVAPAEPVRGFSDLTQGDGLGLRTQFLAVGSTVAEPTSRPTTPPATVPSRYRANRTDRWPGFSGDPWGRDVVRRAATRTVATASTAEGSVS